MFPFIPLPLDTLPYQIPNFLIFRTVASIDTCQSAVTARVIATRLYSTQKAHIDARSSRTVCCQTVRDCPRCDNVGITPNRYLYDPHSCRKYLPAGEKRDPSDRKESQQDIALCADHS